MSNYVIESNGVKVLFKTEKDKAEFLELREFYSGFLIDTLCYNLSVVSLSIDVNYSDVIELYDYQQKLWKIITYYICIWEESLIADFNRNYTFKKGSKKSFRHPNQIKRGDLYVENIEKNKSSNNDFYLNFDQTFGVFRAICCNPDIRNEYKYKDMDWHTNIRYIDKLNKYRNKVIHDVYVLFDKNPKRKNENKKNQIQINLMKLYEYLPNYHKKTFFKELEEIKNFTKGGIVEQHFSISLVDNIHNSSITTVAEKISERELKMLQSFY